MTTTPLQPGTPVEVGGFLRRDNGDRVYDGRFGAVAAFDARRGTRDATGHYRVVVNKWSIYPHESVVFPLGGTDAASPPPAQAAGAD